MFNLIVTEFRRSSGSVCIEERGPEAALFEPVQPVGDRLPVLTIIVLDLSERDSFPAKVPPLPTLSDPSHSAFTCSLTSLK